MLLVGGDKLVEFCLGAVQQLFPHGGLPLVLSRLQQRHAVLVLNRLRQIRRQRATGLLPIQIRQGHVVVLPLSQGVEELSDRFARRAASYRARRQTGMQQNTRDEGDPRQ